MAVRGRDTRTRRRRLVAASLVVLAVIWVFVNKPVEGPIILPLTRTHSVTAADLVSVALVLVALVLLVPWRR